MDKFDLIDIDESSLADVNISDEQKNKIRKSIQMNLNWALSNNKDLELDTSLSNIFSIYSSLGPERDETIHLTKHAKVLQHIVLDAFNKKYTPLNDELLCSKFLNTGGGSEFKDITPFWGEFPFYYQIYISKEYMYSYSFSNTFKLIKEKKIPLTNIKCAFLSSTFEDNMKFTHENLIIKLDYTKEDSTELYFVSENPKNSKDINEVLNILLAQGVSPYIPVKKHGSELFVAIFLGLLFFLTALIVIFGIINS